jgi:hypothetical protein
MALRDDLSPSARDDARRILNGAAQRLLAARRDRDPIVASAGSHDGLGDGRPDQRAALGEGEYVPVPGRNGHSGR